ncbi:MAG TPA: S9 family peptidase [Vicinamibacterales bacterium]
MRSIYGSLVLTVILVTIPVHTDSRRFELDDLSRVVRIADPQFAPDGRSIAAVISRANLDEDRWDAELASIDVGKGVTSPHMLTSGRRDVSSPRFSPDGAKIAFLMMDGPGKDAHLQVFTIGKSGAEPKAVTNAPTGVQQFAWSPDGKTIAFASADQPERKTGPERFNDSFEIVNDDFTITAAVLPTHLWVVSSGGGTSRRLTSGSWSLPTSHPPGPPGAPIAWSPDSKSIAFTEQATPHTGGGQQRSLQVINVADGSIKPLGPRGSVPIYSPDGKTLAYTGTVPTSQNAAANRQTPGQNAPGAAPPGGNNEIVVFTPGSESRALTTAIDRNMARALWFPDDKSLLVGGNDSTRVSLWVQPLDGAAKKLDLGDVSPSSSFWVDMTVGPKGEIAFTGSTSTQPAELYYKPSPDAPLQRLTDLNKEIASLHLGRTEVVEWTNDEYSENGLLTYPPDFDPSRKYPLVLLIHGGPRAASLMGFSPQAQLLAAHGWLVFQPNYRGSDNLGAAYQRAIRNDAGAGPGRDVWAGMEVVKKRGNVDESRVAVSGWSYGGYMTTWMIGHYQGWKAAVAGAAVTDQLDQYNLGDGNGGRGNGSPWADPKAMDRIHEQSPITYVSKMKTPTLILTDLADYRVPPMQSFKLYHALVDNGVAVKFVGYPVHGHSPTDPVRQRDVQRRWTGWLSEYLDKPTNVEERR